jgi:hypothetical protein
MNGCDRHDQLRLHSYSVQRSRKFVKYYKSLFLGFVDMAIVNAYIVHKEVAERLGERPFSHRKFVELFHVALIGVTSSTFSQIEVVASGSRATSRPKRKIREERDTHVVQILSQAEDIDAHKLEEVIHWKPQIPGRQNMRQYYTCKVCQLTREDPKSRGRQTVFACVQCSSLAGGGQVYLCQQERKQWNGVLKSCFDTWHFNWRCGADIPSKFKSRYFRAFKNKRSAAPTETVAEVAPQTAGVGEDRHLSIASGDVGEEQIVDLISGDDQFVGPTQADIAGNTSDTSTLGQVVDLDSSDDSPDEQEQADIDGNASDTSTLILSPRQSSPVFTYQCPPPSPGGLYTIL